MSSPDTRSAIFIRCPLNISVIHTGILLLAHGLCLIALVDDWQKQLFHPSLCLALGLAVLLSLWHGLQCHALRSHPVAITGVQCLDGRWKLQCCHRNWIDAEVTGNAFAGSLAIVLSFRCGEVKRHLVLFRDGAPIEEYRALVVYLRYGFSRTSVVSARYQ